jgi:hypothetical protein
MDLGVTPVDELAVHPDLAVAVVHGHRGLRRYMRVGKSSRFYEAARAGPPAWA